MRNKIAHIRELIECLGKAGIELEQEHLEKEFRDNPGAISDDCINKIAAAIEYASPVFRTIPPNGIELVKLIGNGTEDNNHDALISFIYKLRVELSEYEQNRHYDFINYEIIMKFDQLGLF